MNRQRHRLVFSRRLGALVAVAETARAHGKAASGARAATLVAGALLLGSPLAWSQSLPVPSAGGAIPNFVTAGQAAYQVNGNQAIVNQVGNKAILNWQQFNVGAGHNVQFQQVNNLTNNQLVQGASFTTLNRIWDINPSVIAGSISQAAGQKANVILVNTNGIAFMGGSQVNLNSFTASTLDIADKYILNGLLGDNLSPQFERGLDGAEGRGRIEVMEGARLSATSQGRVMLIAPEVVNRGSVSADDGQVILAAGSRVFLRADDSADLNLRGLLVEVDSPASGTSVASNFGELSARRGNVTMVGYAVNQMGRASATSSVVANGSVYLMAKDTSVFVGSTRSSSRGGEVVLGAQSVTEVTPEEILKSDGSITTAQDGNTGTGLAEKSQVRVLGQRVYMDSGAAIVAPSGDVAITAVDNPSSLVTGTSLDGAGTATSAQARIHIADGARIDVAGLDDVQVSAARNAIEVELRGDELKDSPLNRNGVLRGEKAYVDIEQALANADAGQDTLIARDSLLAYQARLERGARERSTEGGRVTLRSEGETIVEQGATIDLSGGQVRFTDGVARTTVLAADGKLVDLADADANTRYDGIVSRYVVDYGRWNEREVIELPTAQRFVQGYTEGKNAGSLNIQSMGAAYFGADVQGRTTVGERQQLTGNLPAGARVTFGTDAVGGDIKDHKLNQNVVIARGGAALPGSFARNEALPDELKSTLSIDADLLGQGRASDLAVFTNQAAEVRNALRTPQGGSVTVAARNLAVVADITAQGGNIELVARNNARNPIGDVALQVADGVSLSVQGNWVNRTPGLPGGTAVKPVLNGGSLSISAEGEASGGIVLGRGTVQIGQGVRMNADGGASVDAQGEVALGSGGSIAIAGNRVQGLDGANLQAHGLDQGGSLSITSEQVQIGGSDQGDGALLLGADSFETGGFASYRVQGLQRLTVAEGAQVTARVERRVLAEDALTRASGSALDTVAHVVLQDETLRPVASLTLAAGDPDAGTGELRVGAGARVAVEPGGQVALQARNRIEVQGEVVARGGTIDLTLDRSSGFASGTPTTNTLWLGSGARLDASGVAQVYSDDRGLTQGRVLDGGTVNLDARTGYVVAEQGAEVNVSGAAPVTVVSASASGVRREQVASSGGAVNVFGEEGLLLDATFKASGGSAQQQGGALSVTLSKNARLEGQTGFDAVARTLVLANTVAPQTADLNPGDAIALTGEERARLGTEALEAAGFERLRFASRDGIVLQDGLAVGAAGARSPREITLDAARIESAGQAHLMADAVRLGNFDSSNRGRLGTAGSTATTGALRVDARLAELAGNLRLQGMARNEITGSEQVQLTGVTRADGSGAFEHSATIDSTGDLLLRGGAVSPTSFADITVRAAGRDVRIEGNGVPSAAPVWSAAGQLRIEAQNITQAGRLVAPFGRIELAATDSLTLAPGSETSVSAAAGQVLPLGQVQNGNRWVVNLDPDNVPAGQVVLDALPDKAVDLSGNTVRVQAGAEVVMAGGGDVQAYEFSVGPGGSRDILADDKVYAIVPGYQSGFAPGDPQERTGLAVGTAVRLEGVPGLADGSYTLLPAHYALLPGAMAVRLGDAVLARPETGVRQDGVALAAGYLTGSGSAREGGWRSAEVFTREQVLARSEFTLSRASNFFAEGTSRPQDAGRLALSTQGTLELDGRLLAGVANGGRGLAVDIAAPVLVIADDGATGIDPNATRLDVQQINAIGAESLLLGGTRTRNEDGTALDVRSNSVTLANSEGSALKAPEVMLAARDTVDLREGSAIDAQGADRDAGHYTARGNGAFLRAASSSASFSREGSPDRSQGTLLAPADTLVQAARSITLDATRDNRFEGERRFERDGQAVKGELAVGASRINLGDPTGPVEGLTFRQEELDRLSGLASLALSSYSTIDVHGAANVGGSDADGRPTLERLSLQGGGLAGAGQAGDQARLAARELTLSNAAGAAFAPTSGGGSGTLLLQADALELGAGSKTIDGFSAVAIDAGSLRAGGAGSTTLQVATTIRTDRITGRDGASQQLALAAGQGTLALTTRSADVPVANADGLGAGWQIEADALDFDTRARLASGTVALSARTGDVRVGGQADIDVSGRDQAFFDTARGTWGGDVTLTSRQGDVQVTDGARIDVSSGQGADAGRLSMNAVNGRVVVAADSLRGEAVADAGGARGAGAAARFDALDMGNAGALNAALGEGFTGERNWRARSGDIDIAADQTVRAERIALAADSGSIALRGQLIANGENGGQVRAHAGQSLTLHGGARIEAMATAADGDGGRVELSAGSGSLALSTGSQIDVSAGARGGEPGRVNLRAQRSGNDVAVSALAADVRGAGSIDIEAVRVYEGISTLNASGASSGSTLSLATINANDSAYAANHDGIKARLGVSGNPGVHIVSGTEVRSPGNLTLGNGTAATDWNLASAAPGGEPGVLTLRAQGNLSINSHVSDGFSAAAPITGTTPATVLPQATRGGRSWSYRFVAGADAGAADPLATQAGVGDLTLAAGKVVRTGAGDIDLAAGRDIVLASSTSAVYTAGRAADEVPGFANPIALQRAFYTQGGGDVSLQAGRDIKGSASSQLYSDWLFRQGRLDADGTGYLTGQQGTPTWWVRFDQFAQGVGALGGGDVRLQAGRDVSNVSASAPTQARMGSATPDASALVKTGGGDVQVSAEGNVLGGQYMADEGRVRVVAGGEVGSGQSSLLGKVYPVIALGDAQASVRARGDVQLHGVVNPTLVVQSFGANDNFNVRSNAQGAQRVSIFSTYGAGSAASLSSLNGDVILHDVGGSSAAGVSPLYTPYPVFSSAILNVNLYRELLGYLPPTLKMTAFSGDVKLGQSAAGGIRTLLPAAQGQLELLASDSVAINTSLTMSDNDPAQVASVLRPTQLPGQVLAPIEGLRHGATPVHAGDATPARIYAVAGDVSGVSQTQGAPVQVDLAKAVHVRAGRDVDNLSLAIQHAQSDDRSLVEAGRDVVFAAAGLRTDAEGIRIGGQGRLAVRAGRDVRLGTSGGILSRGDLDNSNLPAGGADIEVMAGLGPKGFDADGALERLQQRLAGGSASDQDLWLARWLTGNSALDSGNAAAAVAEVAALDDTERRDRVRDFVFTALLQSGRDANRADSGYAGDFSRGYAALDLVFPGIGEADAQGRFDKYTGVIDLFASRIKTERGGSIDLLVPGGGMVVGLANTPAALVNVGNNVLGIVAAAEGDVRAATRDDILVNQSRVLTVGGGDVLLWSSEGDIDAGKGKKTASAVPPPVVKVDAQGNVTQELLGAASGSGIGALSTGGVAAGDVDLIAPKGTVNAGDAGIRAGNLNIAAQVVLGADNISVSGTSAGTPVADTSAVTAAGSGATTGGDDASRVVEALNEAAAESAKAAQELASSLRPAVVRVDVLGYGE